MCGSDPIFIVGVLCSIVWLCVHQCCHKWSTDATRDNELTLSPTVSLQHTFSDTSHCFISSVLFRFLGFLSILGQCWWDPFWISKGIKILWMGPCTTGNNMAMTGRSASDYFTWNSVQRVRILCVFTRSQPTVCMNNGCFAETANWVSKGFFYSS